MNINAESLESVITETEEEIERLTRALAALKEASAFLGARSAPSSSQPSDTSKPVLREAGAVGLKTRPTFSQMYHAGGGDLAGLTLVKVAELILKDANEPDGLSPDEITRRAIARGYKSTSSRNPTNDPRKIATSIRVTLAKLDSFDVKNGKIRLKKWAI